MLVREGGAGEARLGLGFLRGMLGLVVTVVVGAAVAGTGCGASLAAAACTAALVLVVPLLIAVASSGRLLLDAPGTSGSFLRGMERMSFFLGESMVGRTSAVDWSEWVTVVAAALRASSSTTMRIHPSSRKEGLRVSEIHRKERTRERKRERVDPPPQRPIENDPGGSPASVWPQYWPYAGWGLVMVDLRIGGSFRPTDVTVCLTVQSGRRSR